MNSSVDKQSMTCDVHLGLAKSIGKRDRMQFEKLKIAKAEHEALSSCSHLN